MKDKVTTQKDLASLLEVRRRQGQRIVFTNGCFDLMHIGHIRYLQAARNLGDVLVVGVNSDESVRALNKGTDRPIVPDAQRAEVLAALACVDYVVTFSEPDPGALIATLQPDILVKGGDWPVDKIVGAPEVLARDGRVVSIPFIHPCSTTGLLEKIRRL